MTSLLKKVRDLANALVRGAAPIKPRSKADAKEKGGRREAEPERLRRAEPEEEKGLEEARVVDLIQKERSEDT